MPVFRPRTPNVAIRAGISSVIPNKVATAQKAAYMRILTDRGRERLGPIPGGPVEIPYNHTPTVNPVYIPGGSLTPGTFPAPGPYTSGLGFDAGPLTNTACSFISDARLRALCMAAGGIFGGGGGGGGGNGGGGGLVATNPCPTGYHRNAAGACQVDGMGGFLPGDIGMQDFGWGTVNGRYGAGYVPIVVQRNYSACPPGSKLGKDGVCYDRIARTNRKHDPGARPFMTGGEVNIVRRAARLQKRGAKLLRKLIPARRPCAAKPKRKR